MKVFWLFAPGCRFAKKSFFLEKEAKTFIQLSGRRDG
jgi:hypothetical protein